MTGSADFTAEQWDIVREGPTSAGMIVSTAQRGGSFREVFAMAKAYTEARREHGDSELLDEIVSHKPEMDKTKAHSAEELKEHGLRRIREAVALVEQKASAEELADYRRFVVSLSQRVAGAKSEGETDVSEAESAAIAEITQALGADGPAS
jgi:predicted house-cleaning noncanonical NTP pyrophosphatase (MazG superfamily)